MEHGLARVGTIVDDHAVAPLHQSFFDCDLFAVKKRWPTSSRLPRTCCGSLGCVSWEQQVNGRALED